jgi:hypothetical protein
MKRSILFLASVIVIFGVQAQNKGKAGLEGRKISIVITAENTNFRLSKSTKLLFSKQGQPLETD